MTGMKMEEVYGHHPENDAAHDEASVTSCAGPGHPFTRRPKVTCEWMSGSTGTRLG